MLNEEYKISIIIPVYNIAEYLPRCLDSVLAQTYTNLEIILVNDGSTDDSARVIDEYAGKDSRIVVIHKENSGVSDTRNKGIDVATGDFIGFVDGDDYIEPEMFEFLLDNAKKYNADISHCGYQMVFPSRVDYYYNTGKKLIQDNKQGLIDLLNGKLVEPSPCNKLYKREVIKDVRMPLNIKNNEDYLFNVKAFVNSKKSVFEDKALYHYILRKNSAATSGLSENKMFDPIIVREEVAQLFKNDEEIYPYALNNVLRANINVYRALVTNINAKKFCKRKGEIKTNIKRFYGEAKNMGILSKRTKIDVMLILYLPIGFKLLYKVYGAFSKNRNKYEVK